MWLLKSKFFIHSFGLRVSRTNKKKDWSSTRLTVKNKPQIILTLKTKLSIYYYESNVASDAMKENLSIHQSLYLFSSNIHRELSKLALISKQGHMIPWREGWVGWRVGGGYGVRVPRLCRLPLSSVGKEFVRVINSWHDNRTSSCGWNQTPSSYHRLKSSSSTSLLWSQLISGKSDMECWPEQGGTRLQ